MRAAAFVRYSGAFGMGHVGWAFDFDTIVTDAGSVENPNGHPSSNVADMGFWTESQPSPVPLMATREYNDAKYVDLASGDPAAAYKSVLWIAEQPYSVIGRNCLDDVYDVLRAYGVQDLPPPSQDWLPNEWFGLFGGNYAHLDTFAWREATQQIGIAALPPRAQVVAAAAAEPPAWRVAGTAEWHDLQAQLAAVSARPQLRGLA